MIVLNYVGNSTISFFLISVGKFDIIQGLVPFNVSSSYFRSFSLHLRFHCERYIFYLYVHTSMGPAR